jgi:hypothetical protein
MIGLQVVMFMLGVSNSNYCIFFYFFDNFLMQKNISFEENYLI